MVAIFTGLGAGITRGSGNVLGGAGVLGSAILGRGGEGVSVNAATGNLVVSKQDEFLVGRGLNAAISRTYNSQADTNDRDNGDGWQQSTTQRVFELSGGVNAGGSSIKRLAADGSVTVYNFQQRNGLWAYWTTDGAGAHDRIYWQTSTTWVWVDADTQVTETYSVSATNSSEWRLTQRRDLDGNVVNFSYVAGTDNLDKVTTANGDWMQYSWSGNTITKITTGYTDLATSTAKTLSRTWYDYTGGKLSQVRVDLTPEDLASPTAAQSYWTQYSYDANGRLSRILQKDGSQVEITYDASGRVSRLAQTAEVGVTRATNLSYGANYTTITAPEGQVTRLDYDAAKQLTKITAPPAYAGAAAQVVQFAYDADGNISSVTDAAGKVTSYLYDAGGNTTRITDPNLNTVERWYDTENRMTMERTYGSYASGANVDQYTRYVYDTQGHLRFVVDAEGRVTENLYNYGTGGTLYATREYAGHIYPAGSTALTLAQMDGWVASITDWRTVKFRSYEYDARGNVRAAHVYSALNSNGSINGSESVSRIYTTYDEAGRLLSRYAQGEATETFVYDGMGRLTASTDVHGGTTTFVFNDTASTTTVTTAAGYTTVQTFNKAGELVSSVGSGSYDVNQSNNFAFDENGWLRVSTDGAGRKSYYIYDNAGQLVGQVNHYGNLTEYRRDAAGRVISEVRYATTISAANLATLEDNHNTLQMSNVRPAANAADIWSWTVYDAAGRVIQTIDGDGGVAAFEYDKSDRLVKTTSYFNKVSVAAFKITSPTSSVAVTGHSSDTVSRTFYDRSGRLIGALDGEGYLTEIVYDQAGQKIEEIAYITRTSSTYWAAGTFAQLRSTASPTHVDTRRARFVYDGQGLLRYQVDVDGQVTSFDYNYAGKLTTTIQFAAPISTTDFTYNNVKAQITSLANDATDRKSYNVYDAAGRLAYSIDASGAVTGLTYDNAGRVTRTIQYAVLRNTPSLPAIGTMDSWASGQAANAANRIGRNYYTAGGLLRFSVDAEGFVRRFDYDATDRKTREVVWDTPISVNDTTTIAQVNSLATGAWADMNYAYDAAGRLSIATDGQGVQTYYTYHANGLLAGVYAAYGTPDQSVTYHLYDGAGRVTQQYTAYGEPEQALTTTTYDGLGNRISVTNPNGKTTYYAYDKAGRVISQTDALNGVTRYKYNAFGEVIRTIDARGTSSHNYYDRLGRLRRSIDAGNYVTDTNYTRFGEIASVKRYAIQSNGLFNPTFAGTDGWVVGWKSTDQLTNGAPYTGPFYGKGSLKLEYNATAANQIISLATDLSRSVSVSSGDILAIDTGVEALGVTNTLQLTVHFFDASGAHLAAVGVDALSGNQAFNTNMSGIVEVPYGAVSMRFELYAYSGSAGAGSFNLVEPEVVRLKGSLPASSADATTSFLYDKLGRVTRATDAEGFFETYTYDAFGNRLTRTAKSATASKVAGGTTTYAYDRRGLLTSETLPVGSYNDVGTLAASTITNTYAYDARGNRIRMVEASGLAEARTTSFAYDKNNRLIQTTGQTFYGQTPVTTYAYDGRGNMTRMTDPAGARTIYYYDDLGRVTRSIDPVGTYTATAYDKNGNVTSVRVYATAVAVPADGGSEEEAPAPAGAYRETTFTYDALNRMTASSIAGIKTGTFNGSSWVSTTAAITTAYEYDAAGNVVKATDANGNATWSWYDLLGRKTVQVDAEGYRTDWTYNADGNVTSERRYWTLSAVPTSTATPPAAPATNALDRITNFTYDLNGNRLTEARTGVLVHNGSGGYSTVTATISYLYNGLGQVTRKTEASGDQINYGYDLGGRLTVEARQAFIDQTGASVTPTVDYYYDGLGNLSRTRQWGSANAAERVTRYGYNGGMLNWMADAEVWDGDDTNGRLTYYWYDIAGRQTAEYYTRYNSAGAATASYDGMHTAYDLAGRVTQKWQATYNGSTWVDNGPRAVTAYNAFGEVVSVAIGGVTQQQNQYDNAGRLIATNSGDGVWKHFGYDKNGNQTIAITSAGASLAGKTFDQAFALIAQNDVNPTYTVYDKRNMARQVTETGRQLAVGGAAQTLDTYRTYNAFGEVASETNALNATINYTYNNMGRLIKTESPTVSITSESGVVSNVRPTEQYYYDAGGRLVATRDANNNLTRLTLLAGSGYGGSQAMVTAETHADGGVKQFKYDIHGDMREMVDELGYRTLQTFDKMGRITVRQELRNAAISTDDFYNYYTYNGLGQQLKHWNNQFGASDAEVTDYDIQGRVISARAFGGDTTTTSYTWEGGMVTAGLGTFGGWSETTTFANGLYSIEKTDLFGRVTYKRDLGAHVTSFAYDQAGRLSTSALGGLTTSFTWLNSGLVGQQWTGSANSGQVNTSWNRTVANYSYDKAGNRLTEQLTAESAYYTPAHWEYPENPYDPRTYEAEVWDQYYGDPYWVEESYYVYSTALKNQSATYDALGRMRTWTEAGTGTSPAASIANEYDAAGNVRRTLSTYRTLDPNGTASSSATTRDYWFRYDSMNRVVVNQGVLENGVIQRGFSYAGLAGSGQDIAYNAAGQRTSVATTSAYFDGYGGYTANEFKELYYYDAAGRLIETRQATGASVSGNYSSNPPVPAATGTGTRRSLYGYDLSGRQTSQTDYATNGTTAVFSRTASYNNKSQLTSDYTSNLKTDNKTYTTSTSYNYGTPGTSTYMLGAVVSQSSTNTVSGSSTTYSSTTNTYQWWDGAVQNTISYKPNTSQSTTYTTTFYYDDMGRLNRAYINDGKPHSVYFTNDELGQIIRRDETNISGQTGAPHEVWYRFSGRQLGYTGNNGTSELSMDRSIADRQVVTPTNQGTFRNKQLSGGSYADFAQNYDPINSYYQGSAGGSYTVQRGDTLQGIAQSLWGDASLWYKIAEANGLGAATALIEGQRLILPTGVIRNTNNAGSANPYNPAEAMGDLSPSTSPKPKKNKCGVLGAILIAVVAIAVAIVLPELVPALAPSAFGGGAVGAAVSGAIGAAAGSVVSQGVGIALGIQNKFSFKGVALAALGGAVGGALKGVEIFGKVAEGAEGSFRAIANAAASGALGSAINQGIGVATGLQDKFSWAGVAAAGVAAGVGQGLGKAFDLTGLSGSGLSATNIAGHTIVGAAGLIASAATRSAIEGSSFGDNISAGLPDVIGQTVGRALGGAINQKIAENRRFALMLRHLQLAQASPVTLPGQSPVMTDAGDPTIVVIGSALPKYQSLTDKEVTGLEGAGYSKVKIAEIDNLVYQQTQAGSTPSPSAALDGGDVKRIFRIFSAGDDNVFDAHKDLSRRVQNALIDTDLDVIEVRSQFATADFVHGVNAAKTPAVRNLHLYLRQALLAGPLGLFNKLNIAPATIPTSNGIGSIGSSNAAKNNATIDQLETQWAQEAFNQLKAATAAGTKAADGTVLGNTIQDQALRSFAYSVGGAFARERVDGKTSDHEKVFVINSDANGYYVSGIQIMPGQGGQSVLSLAGAVAVGHTHQDKDKIPGGGDPRTMWRAGIPNFTVGGIGNTTLTEVGRYQDRVIFRDIDSSGLVSGSQVINWGNVFGSGISLKSYNP